MCVLYVFKIAQQVPDHAKHRKRHEIVDLTHSKPMYYFCTLWKHQQMFSGCIDMDIG